MHVHIYTNAAVIFNSYNSYNFDTLYTMCGFNKCLNVPKRLILILVSQVGSVWQETI